MLHFITADECTDIATVEGLSLFCRWVENGSPVEHLTGILPQKKGNAESIYSALIDWLKKKNLYNVASLLAWALMVQQRLRQKSWSSSMTEE